MIRKTTLLIPLSLLTCAASAESHLARYGVQYVAPFKLYNADGTLDIDEADGGTEVSVRCQGGTNATATNDFVDRGSDYEITLTATEMQCATVAVTVAATTTEVFYINTVNHASAAIPTLDADVQEWGGAAIATPSVAGVPEVDVTHWHSSDLLTGTGPLAGLGVLDRGTAQSDGLTSLQLRAAAPFADDELIGALALYYSATTGAGQRGTFSDYVGSTDTATLNAPLVTDPTGTLRYEIYGTAYTSGGDGGASAAEVWSYGGGRTITGTGTGAIAASSFAAGAIDAAAIAADAIGSSELAANSIGASEAAADLGADLASIPWNASWDAEVQSEAADAINADTGDTFTAIPWNSAWDAEAQSEANDAIVANLLDRLLLNTYDPASPPGAADSFLEDLVESDAGVTRFTVNALEQAPAGGGGTADWNADERTAIRAILGVPASGTTPDDPTTGILDTTRDAVAGVQSDANDIQARIPAALVSGRMDASVGAYQTGLTPLQPTVAGRTFDVSATGEGGIDWANVGSPTTSVTLSGTTVGTSTALGTGAVNTTSVATGAFDADALATDAVNEIWGVTCAEPAAKPAWGSTDIKGWLCWAGAWSRNEINQTATQRILRNDADSANLATCAVGDDGTTFSVAECTP